MKLKIEKYEFINKTFKIEQRILKTMEKDRNQKNISLNKLVSACVQYALDNLEKAKKIIKNI